MSFKPKSQKNVPANNCHFKVVLTNDYFQLQAMIVDLHVINQLLKEILVSPREEEKRWDKYMYLGHLKQCRKSDGFPSWSW